MRPLVAPVLEAVVHGVSVSGVDEVLDLRSLAVRALAERAHRSVLCVAVALVLNVLLGQDGVVMAML